MINFIKNGFFVASVTEEQYEGNKEFYDTLERTEIVYERTLNFIKPKLENGKYVEGATTEEIEDYEDSFYPIKVTAVQFKLELIYSGIKQEVENAINSLQGEVKEISETRYEYATYFFRKDELVSNIALLLGLTKEYINEFFLRASKHE